MDSKNIIFFGGTGLIGNSVLNLLNKKESKIYAFSRQNLVNKLENVKEVIFNFNTLEADIDLNNWDHVYICLGRRLKVWELIYIRKKDRENHFKIEHDYIINKPPKEHHYVVEKPPDRGIIPRTGFQGALLRQFWARQGALL